MKQFLIQFPLCFLLACTTANEKRNSTEPQTNLNEDTVYVQAVKEVQYFSSDSTAVLKSEQRDNLIDFSWVPTESDLFKLSMENKKVFLQSNINDIKTISYCLETSITIQAEGSHYDMINWKHGATNWQRLIYEGTCNLPGDTIQNCTSFGFVIHPDDDENTQLPFPETPMSEVRSEVKKLFGQVWADHLRDVEKIGDYPCSVGISSYIFNVRFQHRDTGKNGTAYLRIPVEMGC